MCGGVFMFAVKERCKRPEGENKAILLSMHSTWLDKLSSSKFPQKEETLKLFPTDTKYDTLYLNQQIIYTVSLDCILNQYYFILHALWNIVWH